MQRETQFNKQLTDILNILDKTCPGDSDLRRAKTALTAMKRLGPKMVMIDVGTYMLPYAQKIIAKDVMFFLDPNQLKVEDCAKQAGANKAEVAEIFSKVRSIYAALDDTQQETILSACKTMMELYIAEMRSMQ